MGYRLSSDIIWPHHIIGMSPWYLVVNIYPYFHIIGILSWFCHFMPDRRSRNNTPLQCAWKHTVQILWYNANYLWWCICHVTLCGSLCNSQKDYFEQHPNICQNSGFVICSITNRTVHPTILTSFEWYFHGQTI